MPGQSNNNPPSSTQTSKKAKTNSPNRSLKTGAGQRQTRSRKKAKESEAPVAYASDLAATLSAGSNGNGRTQESPEQLTPQLAASKSASVGLTEVRKNLPMEERPGEVLRLAEEGFAKTGSWVLFYREMLAPGGVVDQLYDTPDQRRYFEATEEFAELLEIVTSIRSQDDSKAGAHEPERVITVRLPRSMHEATIRQAGELGMSINKYCLTKLLQPANKRFTPLESGFRRGRKPGPQITMTRVLEKASKAAPEKPAKKKRAVTDSE